MTRLLQRLIHFDPVRQPVKHAGKLCSLSWVEERNAHAAILGDRTLMNDLQRVTIRSYGYCYFQSTDHPQGLDRRFASKAPAFGHSHIQPGLSRREVSR